MGGGRNVSGNGKVFPAAHLFPLDSFGSAPFRRERSERAESPSLQSRHQKHRHTVRQAVSLGGDSDTLACITSGIVEAFYGSIPEEIITAIWPRLPDDFHRVLQEMERAWGYPLAGKGEKV